MNLLSLLFGAAIVNNFVFYRFLGICPFLGVSKNLKSALGMGIAVTFVMVIATIITWLLYNLILMPLRLQFLEIVSFILVIASLVQFIEIYMKKTKEALYKAFGIFLPLITTNCAILGLTLINVLEGYNFIESLIYAIGAGLGFIIALSVMATLRERLEFSPIPKPLKGAPIALIIAGILALAFNGFSGII